MSQTVDLERMHVYEVGGAMVYQLLCGRDLNGSMDNYIYLVVNTHNQTAIAVDAAWDIDGIFRFAESLQVRIVAAVYTHCHADHAGGSGVPGCREVRRRGVEAWACKFDADAIRKQNELLQDSDLAELCDGDVVPIGAMAVHAIHTPGHTPGSICLYLPASGFLTPRSEGPASEKEIRVPTSGGLLISGDTLFVGGAGRTDLMESNHDHMLQSLERLCKLPSDTVVLPGHNYDPLAFTTIDMEGGGNSVIANAKAKRVTSIPLPPCCCSGILGPMGVSPGQRVEILPEDEGLSTVLGIIEGWAHDEDSYLVRILPGQGLRCDSKKISSRRLVLRGRRRASLETQAVPYRVIHGTLLRKADPVSVAGAASQKVACSKRPAGSTVLTTGRTWTGAQGTTWVQLHPAHEKKGGWLALHGRCFGVDAELLRAADGGDRKSVV